jgi:hypothetical protein
MRDQCQSLVRGWNEQCQLEAGHTGYHSCATYTCENCGKVRRDPPYMTAPDAPDSPSDAMKFCFICGGGPEKARGKRGWW